MSDIMNAIRVSLKTNTVLVCKDLAEANFRCMECFKAFISEQHLRKHNQKRHGFSQHFTHGSELAGRTNDSELKLTEVTGRLEKALSLLEAKTSSLCHRHQDTVMENLQAGEPPISDQVFLESPQKLSDVRRTVSLFTLPNRGPTFDGWMMLPAVQENSEVDVHDDIGDAQDAQGPNGGSSTNHSTTTENTCVPIEPQITSDEVPKSAYHEIENSQRESPNTIADIEVKPKNDDIVTIEPLLISLISKLDTFSSGNRVVTNAYCQTSETNLELHEELLLDNSSAPGRKSVRFSEVPMYYEGLEQQCYPSSSDSKSEDEGASFAENEVLETYTKHSAQSHLTRPVYEPCVVESCQQNEDVKQDGLHVVENPHDSEQSTDGDGSENKRSNSRETKIPVETPAVANLPNPQPSTQLAETNSNALSADYAALKKQILMTVEKCVKELKDKRKQSTIPTQIKPQEPKNNFKPSSNVICTRNGNITVSSRGISPPCTIVCKDEEVDIDDLSGESYERFMKKFYSKVLQPEQGNDRLTTNRLCARDPANQPGTVVNLNQAQAMNTNSPVKQSGLEKADYAVLLHHETSQVQSLIDTLVSDVQRWKNARWDKLSQDVRVQLEERLASSLKLLGIQGNAKLLSDSATASAYFLLDNRRNKSVKVSSSSYFDGLRSAFVNEVNRIAKSRTNNYNPT